MAQVLTASSQRGDGFRPQRLSRSSSQTSLFLHTKDFSQPGGKTSNYNSNRGAGADSRNPASIPSSAPSSPRLQNNDSSSQPSLISTPSSSLSLDEEYCSDDEDDILFPVYDAERSPSVHVDRQTFMPLSDSSDLLDLRTSRRESSDLSSKPSVVALQSMGDDTAVKREPSRHVDYLSHSWKEEDIWSSWRHIVARRKTLENAERLENASWRTWIKKQNCLKTVSPEKLNWMKDHDVTWLYGPLQTAGPQAFNPDSPTSKSCFSRTNSFSKKPILKKRSVSEAMLQRSLSNSTLIRQAVYCVISQEPAQRMPRPALKERSVSAYPSTASAPAPSPRRTVPDSPSPFVPSSGSQTPGCDRRHIHFNNEVEQCIAINKELDEHEDELDTIIDDDESSDDDIIMMRTDSSKERKLSNISIASRSSFSSDSGAKTIAMLPSTTLKYRSDTPEPVPPPSTTNNSSWGWGRKLVHSSSAETLKPSKPSTNFLLDDDDEDADLNWQPLPSPRSSTLHNRSSTMVGRAWNDEDEEEEMESRGLRRTPSGMFMPYDGDEQGSSGLFGKVADTVNTARDIAHVIWNVGWRR